MGLRSRSGGRHRRPPAPPCSRRPRLDFAFVDQQPDRDRGAARCAAGRSVACRQALQDALAAAGGRYSAMQLVLSRGRIAARRRAAMSTRPQLQPSRARWHRRERRPGSALARPRDAGCGRRLIDAAGDPALLVAMLRTDWLSPSARCAVSRPGRCGWSSRVGGGGPGGACGRMAAALLGGAERAGAQCRRAGPQPAICC